MENVFLALNNDQYSSKTINIENFRDVVEEIKRKTMCRNSGLKN